MSDTNAPSAEAGGNTKTKSGVLMKLVCGFLIGVGGFLPGVSGGVMAVSFGLYRPMVDAVVTFFKNIRKNFLFLLPIAVGGVLGILVTMVGLSVFLDRYETQVMYLFLGLVAGGVPSLLREANRKGFKPRYLIATAVGALLASTLLVLKARLPEAADVTHLHPWQSMLAGAVISVGVVIPGVSTSFILMFLGWYKHILDAIMGCMLGFLSLVGIHGPAGPVPLQQTAILTLLLMAAGAVICGLLLLQAASWFFRRFHGYAYYGVFGFLVVSACLIFPGVTFTLGQLVSLLLAAGGFVVAWFFGRLGQ